MSLHTGLARLQSPRGRVESHRGEVVNEVLRTVLPSSPWEGRGHLNTELASKWVGLEWLWAMWVPSGPFPTGARPALEREGPDWKL